MSPTAHRRKRDFGATGRRTVGSLRVVAPQLATLDTEPPSGEGWVHEVKLDGYRIEGLVARKSARLLTRGGKDWTGRFPAIAQALEQLPVDSAILDGEVVSANRRGRTSFQGLQAALHAPGHDQKLQYQVFDLLFLDGYDLRKKPLALRRQGLEDVLAELGRSSIIRLVERFKPSDPHPLSTACKRGLEGVVSKRNDARYTSGRNRDWIKSKCGRRQEFVVVGFTEPRGTRTDVGALLLAVADGSGGFRYAGKVGSGFSQAGLETLRRRLERLERKESPLTTTPAEARGAGVRWVRPTLVAEVTFTEWTTDGRLRHPVFLGLRDDKAARQVRREDTVIIAGVTLTHPDRVVYPELGLTKQDLAAYYALAAPVMLPQIAKRPLSLLRCPEGESGECFYQKHWTGKLPGIRTVPVKEDSGARSPYAIVTSASDLVRLVQYGVMEFHPWGARADDVDAPDRVIFDLDPDPAVPWSQVREAARALRELLSDLKLKSWLKTSGGKGLHVVLPIERRVSWEVVSAFAQGVARRFAADQPERYVAVASKAARQGRIFIDYLRNSRGATAVAPWSVRARSGAPVATPIRWEDLGALTGGDAFTISEVRALLDRGKRDPWADLPGTRQSITLQLARRLTG